MKQSEAESTHKTNYTLQFYDSNNYNKNKVQRIYYCNT